MTQNEFSGAHSIFLVPDKFLVLKSFIFWRRLDFSGANFNIIQIINYHFNLLIISFSDFILDEIKSGYLELNLSDVTFTIA